MMNISLPENLIKQVQKAKTLLDQGVDTAVKNINQDTQQAKTLVIERTNQSFESINQAKENAMNNLAKAADTKVNSITEKSSQIVDSLTATTNALNGSLQITIEKIDKLNQTLSDGIQASISSSLDVSFRFIASIVAESSYHLPMTIRRLPKSFLKFYC